MEMGIAISIGIMVIVIKTIVEKELNQIKRNNRSKPKRKSSESLWELPTNKTSYQEKQTKGAEYEKYIANIYRDKGYKVIEHGAMMGRLDMGIDLIAQKEKELLLIQCKDWDENQKYKIRVKDIKSLRTDGRDFIEKNPKYRNYDPKLLFVLSGDFIDNGAKNYINEIKRDGKRIDYKIII